MYGELARWWHLISPPEDYAEEAAFYLERLLEASEEPPHTLLELGSGGGNNASHMKASLRPVLVDLSEEMLAVSRGLNPECEHVQGDMRTVRLDREFDCVFVHDAISYMVSEADLLAAIETAYLHCRPGGAALFAPDHLKETFRAATDHGGVDGETEAIRFLEWAWDPDPDDDTCVVDYVYVLRGPDGEVRVAHDRHLEGLFSRSTWLRLLADTGFEARAVPFNHSELEPGTYEVFVARKPSISQEVSSS
jgi:SAM-dependent methyltransferase